jgi:hypothetical protein
VHANGTESSIHIIDKKIGVLEIKEQSHVDADGKRKKKFSFFNLCLLYHTAHHVKIDAGKKKQYKNKTGSAPAVKKEAENEYYCILIFFSCEVIGKKKKREEIEKESDAAEYHDGWRLAACSD